MPIIKIAVACHKPCVLPENDLYLPIHVGAALSSYNLGIQRDDEGENISKKNKQYCELTAQYWIWKNVEADYYGLCHYRRYFSFSDLNFKKNERNQIIAYAIDEENKKKYGLENSELMRKEIESNDIIVPELQNLSNLFTPRKTNKPNTVYQHWIQHHRDLIMKEDLDEMLRILESISPEIGDCIWEYLNGYHFLGFNCFILRKDLFNELCELEFQVLSELEKRVNLEKYSTNLARIYGFMGEIISSIYLYYLEKKGIYKIKHIPLVYFNNTDPLPIMAPVFTEKKNVIPVCFNTADCNPVKFGTIWQSFLDHIDPNYYYDVILLHDNLSKRLENVFQDMGKPYSNISFRPLDIHIYREKYGQLFNLEAYLWMNYKQDSFGFSILPYIPYILNKYSKMIVVDENILFQDSIVELWKNHKNDNKIISAAIDSYIQGCVNDIFYETKQEYLETILKNPYQFFSCSLFLWDFEQYRASFTENMVFENSLIEDNTLLNKAEILNRLCQDNVVFIDTRWSTWIESNSYILKQLSNCTAIQFEKLQTARKNPGAIVYLSNDPWFMDENELYYYFWPTAKKVESLFPLYLQKANYISTSASIENRVQTVMNAVYSSYSYRIGNIFIQPFHAIKDLHNKHKEKNRKK